jgi:hypothetical protein
MPNPILYTSIEGANQEIHRLEKALELASARATYFEHLARYEHAARMAAETREELEQLRPWAKKLGIIS